MEKITLLQNKRIVLAVTGSIAVYKAVDLASKLTQAGALVDVIMTDSAQEFVSTLTFQAVTGRPVYHSMWQADNSGGLGTHIAHVGLGEGADLMLVVPATANTIAKLVNGMADNLLTVTALTARCPILIAPAMDGGMYEHPATQANVKTLVERGVTLVEPEVGRFASGLEGRGRLPDTATLIGHIRRVLGKNGALTGQHLVVSAGATREAFDPVRFISNHSSGKQGYAIAQAALDAGAEVTLISSVNLPTPIGAKVIKIESALDLQKAVLSAIAYDTQADILVMAAAVGDFRPAERAEQKIKKQGDDEGMTITLTRNPDILKSVYQLRQNPTDLTQSQQEKLSQLKVVVGFAAESENLLNNAQSKVERKGLDFIVANDISADDAGFAVDTNRVVVLHKDGSRENLDLMSKTKVAEQIIERIAELLGH
ncbi:MAG: bifunctional phosphopantothenoylcysteine decarboxylase/phosphopantothenate--cysteine ligase CoaBC [Phototrophicaceae bacterium]